MVEARQVLTELPDNMVARHIVINDLLAKPDVPAALAEVEHALQIEPTSLDLHVSEATAFGSVR